MSQTLHADPKEIAKFDRIAAEWWDPKGRFAPLHQINPLRSQYIADTVVLEGARLLDVGCGGGILSEELTRRGAQVTGIDRSEKALAVARQHGSVSGVVVDYRLSSAQELAATDPEPFDAITCLEVLEHVPDVPDLLRTMHGLLKPGGTLFFATLNRTMKSYLMAIVGAEYILNWLPRGTHQWERFIKPSELIGALEEAGFAPQDLRGMSYSPLGNRYSLSHDLDVNYLGCARRPE
ncbi:MAG: bifunctional 3-demethylubiquinol 3-O-methyltransferase/2-polyprenyl-6-hydroxyphenol methylase [Alphaproteobacteria bacterium CG_4_10_14_0_2_um_filter_63_37]|nr:MAG: bifunctional 3-demethylubiquinol 3-O-methyltransferase/2-polyprenyl-6-hydroxyphenol methylase [Proteobacteria bacterium CG1_02_64_396]PJA24606.1 MAG: bifunctional 3-demethylubiquinol 3-O-methyltransferase/2-polyprenyl-6-hydroxyphenol methylase [Alphaproteobacteria bacterium CG_4_10_14_0_2_um_filter_63_37]